MVDHTHGGGRTSAQTLALVFGVAFILAGILGFIPGITTDAPGDFIGDESEAQLLGLFDVSVVHSLVHLLFGVAGLALARRADTARTYLLGGGIIYLALMLLGLIGGLDWLPANNADDVLHLGLAVGLLGAWYVSRRDVDRTDRLATT